MNVIGLQINSAAKGDQVGSWKKKSQFFIASRVQISNIWDKSPDMVSEDADSDDIT